ncbi:hypothetical protein KCP77_11400 [Salmonella enterica subsp. enterica]|nr:hypothetical protein KCP77_11400 [Salmonella enterica subsp. enterica]
MRAASESGMETKKKHCAGYVTGFRGWRCLVLERISKQNMCWIEKRAGGANRRSSAGKVEIELYDRDKLIAQAAAGHLESGKGGMSSSSELTIFSIKRKPLSHTVHRHLRCQKGGIARLLSL